MSFTWVDLLFVGIFVYFALKGWSQGVVYLCASFLAFAASLVLALKYASGISELLNNTFGIESRWSGVIAYFLIAFAAEALISELLSRALSKTPSKVTQSPASQVMGAFVSATSGLFLVAFFLFILVLVPVRGTIKDDIRSSFIAPRVLSMVERYGGPLPGVLKESARELTQFMTIAPDSHERIPLNLTVQEKDVSLDEESENTMLELINTEREKINISSLKMNRSMQDVARAYAQRMLLERFFSHVDERGKDIAARLDEGGVRFLLAGENLAYAPDLKSAHTGLMNSDGHRRNILDSKFARVGIGVYDAGIWGKMFVQVFAD